MKNMETFGSWVRTIIGAGVLVSLVCAVIGFSVGIGLRVAKWVITL